MITIGGITIGRKREAKRPRDTRPSASVRGYDRHWQVKRKWYLRRNPVCVKCGKVAQVVDHIIPHKGDVRLFSDQSNWQALCVRCHNAKSPTERKEGRSRWQSHQDIRAGEQ